jgi:hypothetical protein
MEFYSPEASIAGTIAFAIGGCLGYYVHRRLRRRRERRRWLREQGWE